MLKRSTTNTAGSGERIVSIDAIRGLAILTMVFSHALNWFFTGTSHEIMTLFNANAVGDMATPLFYTISGLSLYLSLSSRSSSQPDSCKLYAFYARRFSRLFLVGLALSQTWGVLQAQAISLFMVITIFLLAWNHFRLKESVKIVLASGLVFLLLHNIFGAELPGEHFLAGIFRGRFPLCAVISLNAVGFYLGYRLQTRGLGAWTAGWGITLIATALLFHYSGLQAIKRMDMSLSFILWGVGSVLLLVFLFNISLWRKNVLLLPLIQVGRDALFLFVAHYLFFFLPLYIAGLLNSFNQPSAVVFAGLLTLGVVFMASMHQKLCSSVTIYGIMESIILAFRSIVLLFLQHGTIRLLISSARQAGYYLGDGLNGFFKLPNFNRSLPSNRLNFPPYYFGNRGRN